jgi:hypothetical protein
LTEIRKAAKKPKATNKLTRIKIRIALIGIELYAVTKVGQTAQAKNEIYQGKNLTSVRFLCNLLIFSLLGFIFCAANLL